MKRIAIAHSL